MKTYQYRVTGDHSRMVYSEHKTEEAAKKAAKALINKWVKEYGWIHPGAEPAAEKISNSGQWIRL